MSEADRLHWDERYGELGMSPLGYEGPPPTFSHVEHLFPVQGRALEIACGRGRGVAWLARRGMEVWAVDVSPVAIDLTRRLVEAYGVEDRCHFMVHDLDEGLPATPPVDLLLCHFFRDERLDTASMERLVAGGVLAVTALSEVGAGPGEFRVPPGGLREAFGRLEILEEGEADGTAWLLGRRPATLATQPTL